jgi:methyl-accepting chemotaxis protein
MGLLYQEKEEEKGGSISTAFNRGLILVYLISVILAIPTIYLVTKNELYSQANKELKLMVDVVRSARGIVRERTRPHFLPKGEFFPPVVSSTVMAKELAKQFKVLQPNYLIRIVSDNPLNKENYPGDFELDILRQLRYKQASEGIQMTGLLQGRKYLISAAAAKVKDGCLICHGSPKTAPKEIVEQYGTTSGYGWHIGEIIGASLVGVPVADLNSALIERFSIVVGGITLLFAIVIMVLNKVVKNKIIQPIQQVTETATDVSHGRSNRPFYSERNDEIGALIRSFELMRRSVNIASKKIIRLTEKKKG